MCTYYTFRFTQKFVSYPMKANSLCSTYGKRSMLYIIPSHLRILCRTRTRVEGDTCQCCFCVCTAVRYVAHCAPCVAPPLRSAPRFRQQTYVFRLLLVVVPLRLVVVVILGFWLNMTSHSKVVIGLFSIDEFIEHL